MKPIVKHILACPQSTPVENGRQNQPTPVESGRNSLPVPEIPMRAQPYPAPAAPRVLNRVVERHRPRLVRQATPIEMTPRITPVANLSLVNEPESAELSDLQGIIQRLNSNTELLNDPTVVRSIQNAIASVNNTIGWESPEHRDSFLDRLDQPE